MDKETDAERHTIKETHRNKNTVMGTQRKRSGTEKEKVLLSHRTTENTATATQRGNNTQTLAKAGKNKWRNGMNTKSQTWRAKSQQCTDSQIHQKMAHGRRHKQIHEYRHWNTEVQRKAPRHWNTDSGTLLNWIIEVQRYAKT